MEFSKGITAILLAICLVTEISGQWVFLDDSCIENKSLTCTIETPEQDFESGCPFLDTILTENTLLHNTVTKKCWFPGRYNSNLYYYEYLQKNERYGIPIDYRNRVDQFTGGDCLQMQKNGYVLRYTPSTCDVKFPHICGYERDNHSFCDSYQTICFGSSNNGKFPICYCHEKYKNSYMCAYLSCSNDTIPCERCEIMFNDYGEPKLELRSVPYGVVVRVSAHLKLKRNSCGYPFVCNSDEDMTSGYALWAIFCPSETKLLETNSFEQQYFINLFYNNGRFWCFGFAYPDLKIVESNVILKVDRTDLTVRTHVSIGNSLVTGMPFHDAAKAFQKLPYVLSSYTTRVTLTGTATVHLAVDESYMDIKEIIEDLNQFESANARLTLFCSAEYLDNTEWVQTALGQTVPSSDLCKDEYGKFITRTCSGDFEGGAMWGPPSAKCVEGTSSEISLKLLSLMETQSTHYLNYLLNDFVLNEDIVEPEDIYIVARMVERIVSSRRSFSIETLTNTISQISDLNEDSLRQAQELYNATDIIIGSFEEAVLNLSRCNPAYDLKISTGNVLVQIIDISNQYIAGMAVFENDIIEAVKRENVFEDFDMKNLQFIVKLDEYLLKNITQDTLLYPQNLVAIFYKKTSLLQQAQTEVVSWIANIFVPGYSQPFNGIGAIELYFRPFRIYTSKHNCAYWNYGNDELGIGTEGRWIFDGNISHLDEFYKCSFYHTTHFALLLQTRSNNHLKSFLVTSAVVLTISAVIVLFMLFYFEDLRRQRITKLFACAAISAILQINALSAADFLDSYKNDLACTLVGILLHYFILLQLLWVKIILYHLLKTLESVVMSINSLKFSIILGVLVPMAPPIVVVARNRRSYLKHEFCFLTEYEQYFGLLVPVLILSLLNVLNFVKMYFTLKSPKPKLYRTAYYYKQVNLCVLLFLSITSTQCFGIINGFFPNVAFSSLTCISAFLQSISIILCVISFRKHLDKFKIYNVAPRNDSTLFNFKFLKENKTRRKSYDLQGPYKENAISSYIQPDNYF